MTSAYLAISFLKETPLPYKGTGNVSKHDLIEMIISEKKLHIHKKMMIYQKKKLTNYLKTTILIEKKILHPK